MPPPSVPQQLRTTATVASAEFIPRGYWQLNEACGICGRGFIGMLRRRHHCRHCGMSVCGRHSRYREIVPSSLSPVRQRVCDECRPACERGVTRPRRRTLGTRTISVRFDDGDSKETTTTSTSTSTTVATVGTSTDSYSAPMVTSRPHKQHRRPLSPRQQLAAWSTAHSYASARNLPSNAQRHRHHQPQPQPQPQAATNARVLVDQQPPPPVAVAHRPLRSAINRKVSCASTVSATESETLEAEPAPEEVEEEDSDGERAAEEHTRDSASSSNSDCDSAKSADSSEPKTPSTRLNLDAVALAYLPAEPKAKPPKPTTLLYEPTEPERRVMHEIATLELAIQKHQSELPALLERLQHTQRVAARLQAEAHESRLRVLQYQTAQRVVARAVRNARTLMREREFQAAILELLRAAGIDRASAAVYHLLAECRLQVAQLEDAELACRTSIRLRQQQASPVHDVRASVALLGRVLHAQGRLDEAVACFLTALGR